jgi:hypothetical protein
MSDLLLKVDRDELVEEADVVSRVVSVPDGEEDEDAKLARLTVVQELETLVDVVSHPGVGVDVERLNHVSEPEMG